MPTTTTTTTTLAPCIDTGVVEDDLVCKLQRAINSTSVYHLKVLQQDDATSVFPCVVYERVGDTQLSPEMDGNDSGFWIADFSVFIATPDGDQLRRWTKSITALNGQDYNVTGYITASDDSEEYDTPIELQEIGLLLTLVKITITREGK